MSEKPDRSTFLENAHFYTEWNRVKMSLQVDETTPNYLPFVSIVYIEDGHNITTWGNYNMTFIS